MKTYLERMIEKAKSEWAEKTLFYGCFLKASHKTNLQLFQEYFDKTIPSSKAFFEIEQRGLGYLFDKVYSRTTLQDFYEMCKMENIDLLFIRGED